MNRFHSLRQIAALSILAATLTACGPATTPTVEPTPTRPMRATFTPTTAATNTPVPTDTPVPTNTPVATDTPTPAAPKAKVGGSGQVNARSGPGTAYDEIGQVASGTELDILATNPAGDWYQVCCVNDQNAWIVARLVEVTGDLALAPVAENIPALPTAVPVPTRPPAVVVVQPTPRPVQPAQPVQPAAPAATPVPTQPPVPTATPVPAFPFTKLELGLARASSNSWITFYAMLRQRTDLVGVGGYKLIVQGPGNTDVACSSDLQWGGGPEASSKFLYNCKAEIPSGAQGVYRVFPADMGGNPAGEAYEITVQGDMREFFPRWRLN